MRIPKLSRLLALSSLIGLFALSLQSLQLRYIELPGCQQAARNLIKIKVDQGNKIILKMHNNLLQLAAADKAAIDASNSENDNLKIALFQSKSDESKDIADVKELATKLAATDHALGECNKAGSELVNLVQTQYMPIDQCVAFKKPMCMNNHDEMKGTDGDGSACSF